MSQNNLEICEFADGSIGINYWDSIGGDDVVLKFVDGKWFLSVWKNNEIVLIECDLIEQLKRCLAIQRGEVNEYAPKFNEAEFNAMVEKGTVAWKDVPDDWLEELRGNE